jgi:hypothetical protein
MTSQATAEQAERELAEIKSLIDEQFEIVARLKRLGADTHDAMRLLIDLLELQQTREQRLAQVRLQRRRWKQCWTKLRVPALIAKELRASLNGYASEALGMSTACDAKRWLLIKATVENWVAHKDAMQGAALAYYSIFSVGPLLVIAIAIAGLAFGQEAARGERPDRMLASIRF